MSLLPLCFAALLLPQGEGRPGKIKLPPPKVSEVSTEDAAREDLQSTQKELFHREASKLRRSLHLSSASEELLLQHLSGEFEHPEEFALQLARSADADLVHGLLRILRRFGSRKHGESLQFLLLTRPFASATREAVAAMVDLLGDGAKDALLVSLTSRYSGVRKASMDLLLARLGKEDVPRLIELSRGKKEDIKRKALFLLGALPYPEASERLVETLSTPAPTLAAAACQSLIAHGPVAVPALQAIVSRPPENRSFGYAAFALSVLEAETGKAFLDESMLPYLRMELTGTDTFMQVAVALALANLAFRSDDARGVKYSDREVVDALMHVAAPSSYVTNTSLVHEPVTRKLVEFSGQDFGGSGQAWKNWWKAARATFVGMRLTIPVTAESGRGAILTWISPGEEVRIVGEKLVLPPPSDEVRCYKISGAEMAALVEKLTQLGFMGRGVLASAAAVQMMPVARTLELRVGDMRAAVKGPAAGTRWLDVLQAEIAATELRERWQLYPSPEKEADFGVFWTAERKWMAANTDPRSRDKRLKECILVAIPELSPSRQASALRHLLSINDLQGLLLEEDGLALARLALGAKQLDEQAFGFLEASLLAPGDRVWRYALDVIDGQYETGGKEVLARVFSLLGPDKVLAAFQDGRRRIRMAAIFEVANLKDLRAVPALTKAMDDDDSGVSEAAIYCLGVLKASSVRDSLLVRATDPQTSVSIRRTVWMALGRIGGEGVLPVLQGAVTFPDMEDRLVALRAMGEMIDPAAAFYLAQTLATQGLNPKGTQAVASLRRQGALLARPALRRWLSLRDARVRREIVMLLAEFQDPMVVPDLIALLDEESPGTRAALLLSTITGLDVTAVNDRAGAMREWWRSSKDLPQAVWFLRAIQRKGIETTLTAGQLAPGAGVAPVAELTRIMIKSTEPHVRVLAAALLREVTQAEFGQITMLSTVAQIHAAADRYRFFAASEDEGRKR